MDNFATWMFGLAAETPVQYIRLRRIRRAIYTRVGRLKAEIVRSPEPIPFPELDRTAFRPFHDDRNWGGVLDCAWLRITGDVPAGAEGSIAMLGIRGEALIYSADGEVIDSVSRVFQQGDHPHSGGHYRPMSRVDTTTGHVEFYADVSYNGWLLYPWGFGYYHGTVLATRNEEAFGYYYDYLTLLVLATHSDDRTLVEGLNRALDESFRLFRRHDIAGARAVLAGPLSRPSDSEFVYSAIGHGHLDMAWLWPLRETHRKAARTYTRALNYFEDHDSYLYGTSQPQQMFWMKQEQPAIFERMKKAVAAHRLELQGSFWVETDTNMPGGESLVRQSLVGRKFLSQEFGLTAEQMRLCWLPDTFGYSGNLPQILKKSGMDWFQTIKLSWNKVNVFPHRTFNWEGIDGSSVLVHMPPEGDYNSRGAADGLLLGVKQYPERDLNTALLLYGSGDGGGGPNEIHLELTGREHDLLGLPKVRYESANDFFLSLEKMDVEPRHRGELYLEAHQGTYTTQGHTKRWNRIVERKLHEAEALAAIAGESSSEFLEPLWRDVLLAHFHDILPGSAISRVNAEIVETLIRVSRALDDYIADLTAKLPHSGTGPRALNLTSVARDEYVDIDGRWYSATTQPYATATLVPVAEFSELVGDDDSLTNGVLTLRFGKSGEIVSCVDASGAEQSAGGFNRMVLHRDPYQFPFDAWDIGTRYLKRKPRLLAAHHMGTRVDGPRIIRTHHFRFGRSRIEQRIILEAGSDLVRFETTVVWHEKHKMLRTEFRPVHYGDAAKCEIQFGHIERTTLERDDIERAQFEIVAHKWIATEDATGGFALLNDCKFGHRAKSGLISLNLMRSPTFPDKTADRGSHEMTYAFRPFATDDLAGVIRDGYRLNHPLLIADGVELPSVASTDNPAVIIETIKRAEDDSGVVVRLYESLGTSATTTLRTSLPHKRVHETNLMEVPIGPVDLAKLTFTPFEIKTLLLEG
ncbi:MAG TPA: glycoside hydrolase family 38 C-terminal domain-containing protein [Galbitalea sp.]|nr:glycoside hydrolase family 38 C-terminal domain-containing protein [Galbitalea sp.]